MHSNLIEDTSPLELARVFVDVARSLAHYSRSRIEVYVLVFFAFILFFCFNQLIHCIDK